MKSEGVVIAHGGVNLNNHSFSVESLAAMVEKINTTRVPICMDWSSDDEGQPKTVCGIAERAELDAQLRVRCRINWFSPCADLRGYVVPLVEVSTQRLVALRVAPASAFQQATEIGDHDAGKYEVRHLQGPTVRSIAEVEAEINALERTAKDYDTERQSNDTCLAAGASEALRWSIGFADMPVSKSIKEDASQ